MLKWGKEWRKLGLPPALIDGKVRRGLADGEGDRGRWRGVRQQQGKERRKKGEWGTLGEPT